MSPVIREWPLGSAYRLKARSTAILTVERSFVLVLEPMHVEASTADKLRRAMPAEQAARAVRVEMGSANGVKHNISSATWESRVEIFWRDLKQCVRGFSRSPIAATDDS